MKAVSQEELLTLYQSADVFVLTSLVEGQPQAALEALACEIPVILSDIPAHKDLATEGLVELTAVNDHTHLARKILEVSNDPGRARLIARRRRRFVESRYSWSAVVGSVMSVYES
jgi:glycosyltransferase involved in cell wall biosynthesis